MDIKSRVERLLPRLQPDRPGRVRILSLHGMGALYNQLSDAHRSVSADANPLKPAKPLLPEERRCWRSSGG